MLSPLLRRGTGVLTLAAAFFACEEGPIAPAIPGSAQHAAPIAFINSSNPVHPGDFADPFVLVVDSVYYAYATNFGSTNVPTLRSTDLTTWVLQGDAMPVLPAWAAVGRRLTWAPAVLKQGGRYVLFYTARDTRSNLQCIGRAESPSPSGPFVDSSVTPFLCQTDLGGSIDASVVTDANGLVYLLWKNDGNCCQKEVTIWSQQLSSDGQMLVGPRVPLLHRDQEWEGALIEAPTMWQENGRWHLLYSANRWNTDRYAVGYAECDSPAGPCRKTEQGPVLASSAEAAGPGGAEVFTDLAGQVWVAYHGWSPPLVGYRQGGERSLRLDRVVLTADKALAAGLSNRQSQ
jgi:beta-xylosidase